MFALALSGATTLAAPAARAATYSYVDWTAGDPASGTAAGTITLPDNSTVNVSFAAINQNLTAGTLYGSQVNDNQTNYWNPSTPFISAQVENAPPSSDILQLSGGLNQTYTVTLSEPIKDPIMAIVSLGAAGTRCTYDFDSPFTIVSQGAGYFGGSDSALTALPDDILEGYEGHGTIQFIGTFSTFSWTVPTPETWHGFTFGIRTTERLEPDTGAGGAGGGGNDGGTSSNGGASNDGGTPEPGAGGQDTTSYGGEVPVDEGRAGESAGGSPSAAGQSSGGSAAGKPSSGGKSSSGDGSSSAGEAQGGAEDEYAVTKDDAGCNCSVPGGSFGTPAGAGALLVVASLLRRARRRSTRSP